MPCWNSWILRLGTRTITSKASSRPRPHYRQYQGIDEDVEKPESQRPINAAEFHNALHKIWKPVALGDRYKDSKIGIAVSGGLDSMALAILCWSLRIVPRDFLSLKISFHAFVVDHCARPSSRLEAEAVEQYLKLLEVPCTILTLQWPEGKHPYQLSNFETLARRMRYQALGSACRDRQIQSLLVAHHNDDQAETVLLRITQGHRGIGLKGIQPIAKLPECWGIHGVHQSGVKELELENSISHKLSQNDRGGLLKQRSKKFFKPVEENNGSNAEDSQLKNSEDNAGLSLNFEDGGINIYRPLLNFSKQRLEATCRYWDVTWIEDETNSNPKLTSRNAIRYILQNSKLPLALQKGSMLELQRRVQQKTRERIANAKICLEECKIMFLDTRSGGLVVRFLSRIRGSTPTINEDQEHYETKLQYLASLLLRRLIEIVTPQEIVSLQSLEFAVNAIFPDIKDPLSTTADKSLRASKFTAGGVLFVRIKSPSPIHREKASHDLLDSKFAWVLTRQPIPSSAKIPPILIDPHNPIQTSSLPSNIFSASAAASTAEALTATPKFHLWDGRFWLRVHNPLSYPLIVRHLHPADITFLRIYLPKSDLDSLIELLREAAPGKIRYTLPVIAELTEPLVAEAATDPATATKEEVKGGKPRGRMVALPTLGWCEKATRDKGMRWEARYKKVDLGPAGRENCVIV